MVEEYEICLLLKDGTTDSEDPSLTKIDNENLTPITIVPGDILDHEHALLLLDQLYNNINVALVTTVGCEICKDFIIRGICLKVANENSLSDIKTFGKIPKSPIIENFASITNPASLGYHGPTVGVKAPMPYIPMYIGANGIHQERLCESPCYSNERLGPVACEGCYSNKKDIVNSQHAVPYQTYRRPYSNSRNDNICKACNNRGSNPECPKVSVVTPKKVKK